MQDVRATHSWREWLRETLDPFGSGSLLRDGRHLWLISSDGSTTSLPSQQPSSFRGGGSGGAGKGKGHGKGGGEISRVEYSAQFVQEIARVLSIDLILLSDEDSPFSALGVE